MMAIERYRNMYETVRPLCSYFSACKVGVTKLILYHARYVQY